MLKQSAGGAQALGDHMGNHNYLMIHMSGKVHVHSLSLMTKFLAGQAICVNPVCSTAFVKMLQ